MRIRTFYFTRRTLRIDKRGIFYELFNGEHENVVGDTTITLIGEHIGSI